MTKIIGLLLVLLAGFMNVSLARERINFDMKTWSHKQNREEYARIFSHNADKAIKAMKQYLESHKNDQEVLFGLSVAYFSRDNSAKGRIYFQKAVKAGLPIERFMAGPRNILAPLYKTNEFLHLAQGRNLIHGPVTGSVACNSARVWLRTFNPATFKVFVFHDVLMNEPVGSFCGQTRAENDYTGIAQLTGLQSATQYFYTLEIAGKSVSTVCSFKTFPEKTSALQRVAFGGGAFYNPQLESIWTVIAKQRPSLFIGMGDNVYIDHPKLPDVQKFCYYQRQSSAEFQDMLNSVPYYSVWDDHERNRKMFV